MDIEIKDCLVEVKKQNDNLLSIINSNCNNQYFINLQSKIKDLTVDFSKDFGEYLYSIMFPISYKTISGYSQGNGRLIGVGKWFGQIVNTNISYWGKGETFDKLTEEYISFIPKRKQFIVKDFLEFSKELKQFVLKRSYKHEINSVTTLYKVSQILCRSRNPTPNYVYIIDKLLNALINGVNVLYSIQKPFSIDIQFTHSLEFTSLNDVYTITPNVISSNVLERIKHGDYEFLTCLDNPETLLTDQVKETLESIITNGLMFQKKWNDLKMKYAYLLLHKGKI
jgi:hypothetical protein